VGEGPGGMGGRKHGPGMGGHHVLSSGFMLNLMNNFIKLGNAHPCSCVGHGMDDIQAREWAISQFGTA